MDINHVIYPDINNYIYFLTLQTLVFHYPTPFTKFQPSCILLRYNFLLFRINFIYPALIRDTYVFDITRLLKK